MKRIENHKYSIYEAFMECFYIVPDYQREYVWTEKEVYQLLEDINSEMDGSANEYFIGTILVSPTDTKNHFEVIDGQQRLTTFFLMLCALKNLFKDNQDNYQLISGLISTSYPTREGKVVTALKLDPRYENASELMKRIVEINADPITTKNEIQASGITSFGSLENIINAYDVIYRYLKDNYLENGSLAKYWGYLTNDVVFIQISTDVGSALKIFETINERGIGLNPMDLLKNLLFTQVKKDDFNKLKNEWKKITAPLEKHKEKPLRFLRYFLMANYKIENNRNDYIIREDEIYDWFTNKENAEMCNYQNKPFDFVHSIILDVEKYVDFLNGRGNDGLHNLKMDNLKKMCGGAFSLHYILLLAASKFPKYLFDHFLVQLESFLFYYIYSKTPTKELERNFSRWADELRDISKTTNREQQISKYNNFLKTRFLSSIESKEYEMADAMRRYTSNSMQKYRTRYMLAKITQYVDMAYKGIKQPGSISEYTSLEIEHILPNTPSPELLSDFISNNPGLSYDDYKIKLGNLTMLEKPINIVASNDFFSAKSEEYKKSKCYLTSSIVQLNSVGNNSSINRINSKLKAFSEWTAVSIDERQELLLNLSKDIWRIQEYND